MALSGCQVSLTPYEEKAFTTAKDYFEGFKEWLRSHGKNCKLSRY